MKLRLRNLVSCVGILMGMSGAQANSKSPIDFVVEHLRSQISSQMKVPNKDIQIDFRNVKMEPMPSPQKNIQAAYVLGLGSAGSTRLDGLISFSVLFEMEEGVSERIQFSGEMEVLGPAYVAKRNLLREQVLSGEDVQKVMVPWAKLPNSALGISQESLVGKEVKTFVAQGQYIHSGLLDDLPEVRMGESVDITIFSGPGVIIRSKAVAKREGRKGDLIPLFQPETQKKFSGTITGHKNVEIRL